MIRCYIRCPQDPLECALRAFLVSEGAILPDYSARLS